jgi:hypothetical protein
VVLAIVLVVAESVVELAAPVDVESITGVDDAALPSDSDEHAATNIASAVMTTQRSACQRLGLPWFTARVWHPVLVERAADRQTSERSRRRGRGCGRVGLEADLQAVCALVGESIEAVRQQHASEAASLVLVLDAHRFEEPDQRRVVEPEQRVAGDRAIRVLDRQIERRIVQRALSQSRLYQWTVAGDHWVRTISARHAIHDRESIDLRNRRAVAGVHP